MRVPNLEARFSSDFCRIPPCALSDEDNGDEVESGGGFCFLGRVGSIGTFLPERERVRANLVDFGSVQSFRSFQSHSISLSISPSTTLLPPGKESLSSLSCFSYDSNCSTNFCYCSGKLVY